ncbi:MAG: transposase [Calditrichaeota bacterium]|nr:transposase [Calditrichota bacterium]
MRRPENSSTWRGCEMWIPLLKVIRQLVPKAMVVFHGFHLMRHLMHPVNQAQTRAVSGPPGSTRRQASIARKVSIVSGRFAR